jgi:hypothetical protein
MKTVSTSLNESKLKNEWSILFAVTIQGVSPIFNWACNIIEQILETLFHYASIFSQSVCLFGIVIDGSFIIQLLFLWNPVLDALLTIFAVRQYRQVVFGWFKRKSPQVNPSTEPPPRVPRRNRSAFAETPL